ncbi:MAG TPA: potassium transporter [Bacteroidales bacterium]|nr:potassium transporter [Bacteroidales bacterium]
MKLINPLVIIFILSTILLITAASFLLCVPVALLYDESPDPFLWSALIAAATSVLLYHISKKASREKANIREGALSVSLAWIVLSAAGTMPYLLSGSIPSFINAFFETVSGFTTTGASILSDIESLSYSILFWRSLTHWIGGLGIIMFVIIIMPALGMTANQLLPLESSLKEKIHPKTKSVALRLLYVYLGLTLVQILLLVVGEMNLFDSICHTFGTVSTGGFSTKNTSMIEYSAYSQYIIILFMFLSGVSFVIYYHIVKFNLRKVKYNDELWFYIAITMFFGTLVSCILLANTTLPLEPAFREGFFQVVAFITTTGFVSADYLQWPSAGMIILFLLFFAGASTGSTTGSIKMVRHLLVLKNIRSSFTRLVHPSMVTQIRVNNKPVTEQNNLSATSFLIIYIFIFLAGTATFVITGLDPLTAASAAATSLGNVGPGFGSIGPVFNYLHLPAISKVICSLLMIIGRLEIYTFFILFTRSFWKI